MPTKTEGLAQLAHDFATWLEDEILYKASLAGPNVNLKDFAAHAQESGLRMESLLKRYWDLVDADED